MFCNIDLKIGTLTHGDIGQMQMYVNYYKKTQMILEDNKNIYASNYLTYMPTKEERIRKIENERAILEAYRDDMND